MYKVTIETSDQNPQNNFGSPPLLSQVCIKLPKPRSTPRKSNLLLAYQDEYQESLHQYQLSTPQFKQNENTNNVSLKTDSNYYIFSGTRTKNSQASLPCRSQSEIITQWIRSLFQKKGLLGLHWQQKFLNKRKMQLKETFTLLKQSAEGQCSAYLQTQSLYKPQMKRMNKLLGMGCDKILQILPGIINRNFQLAFSNILRFIAFQHLTNKGNKSEENPINPLNSNNASLKSSTNNNFNFKSTKELLLKNDYVHYNVFSNQKNILINQDYQRMKPLEKIKQVTSLRHLNFNHNQYIIAPVSPIANYHPQRISEEKKIIRNINTIPFPNEQKLIQIRQNPNINFNIKTSIPIKDQRSKHLYVNTNPPSPKTHQFSPIIYQNCLSPLQFNGLQKFQNKNPINVLPFERTRESKIRPHSYNPFSSKHFSRETVVPQNIEIQKVENRKQRAISSSPNIKISFIAQPMTPNPHRMTMKHKMNDYETEKIARNNNNLYQLGTLENRQMRQTYQANSIHNQLISQGRKHCRINQPINYAYSSPVSPKALPNMVQFQTIRNNPSPTSHYIIKPQQQHRQQKKRQSLRVDNEYYMKKREKLVVVSSNKRKY